MFNKQWLVYGIFICLVLYHYWNNECDYQPIEKKVYDILVIKKYDEIYVWSDTFTHF
jgi:hypothetical protein